MLYPVYCAHMLYQSDRCISFRTPSGNICTFRTNQRLILALIQKSTGAISADDVAFAVSEEIHMAFSTVKDAIEDLVVCEILIDSNKQCLLMHSLTCNPTKYPMVLSEEEIGSLILKRPDYIKTDPIRMYKDTEKLCLSIDDILRRRHSCRNFQNIPIELDKLFAICRVSCSCQLKPVASAGGLFPLSVYFVNRIPSGRLPVGFYQYNPLTEEILLLSVEVFSEMIEYLLNDADYVFGAPVHFFICADIERHMKKYANRGYRYTLLEVGHAVQNMTVAALEMGLGGVEYGGFYDEAVKRMFQMPEGIFPLACYAVGYENMETEDAGAFLKREHENHIIEKMVRNKNEGVIVSPYLVDDAFFKLSNLQVIVSKFQNAQGMVDFGTGAASTYRMAYIKSVMEAYERDTLSHRYFDFVGCADDIKEQYMDPRLYAPYSDQQIEEVEFAKFRETDMVEWLKGYNIEGESVYIPADLCFDTIPHGKKPYHVANTSGCAAHFSRSQAEETAILELIERDAIIRNWFYRETPYKLNDKDMPVNIRQRLCRYREKGLCVYILVLSCKYAFTVLVCSVNNTYMPYFVSGAAASFSSVIEAAEKAFNEWEVSYVIGKAAKNKDIIVPEEVISPQDHGKLYRYSNYNREIEYLFNGNQINSDEVCIEKLRDLQALSPIFFSYKTFTEELSVIRAFSRELIPVNFGYGMDFISHLKVDRSLLKYNGFPHFFA